ncbi:MAG: carbohydrate ABC transporter permease [Spirochaetia bacterium]
MKRRTTRALTLKKIIQLSAKAVGVFLLTLFLFYMLFPFYYAVIQSLKTQAQYDMIPITLLPVDPESGNLNITFQNFQMIFSYPLFLRGLFNSLIVCGISTAGSLIFGFAAAFALTKYNVKFKQGILSLFLSLMVFPQISLLTGLYGMMRNLHLTGLPAITISYFLITIPFCVWFLRVYLEQSSSEMLEAARVDGANVFQIIQFIYIPIMYPAILSTAMFSFITVFNEYLYAVTFSAVDQNSVTANVVIAANTPVGPPMYAGIVSVIYPLIIVVTVFQRYIYSTFSITGGNK